MNDLTQTQITPINDDIFIRQADLNDLHEIVSIFRTGALISLGFNVEGPDLHAYFHDQLLQQNDTFKIWVAVHSDKVIGWQSILPVRANPLARPFFGESSTYVAPTGIKGVATALLQNAMFECQKTPLQYIIGYILSSNAKAKHIVEKLGWELVGSVTGTSKNFKTSDLHFYYWRL